MNRLGYLDIMRGIAIWLVVIGHVIQYNNCEGWLHHPVFEWIYSFHLPLFFFVSGFLAERTCHVESVRDLPLYIWKKVRSLLLPLIVWSLLVKNFFFSATLPLIGVDDFLNVFAERGLWFLKYLFSISILFVIFHLISRLLGDTKIWKDIVVYLFVFCCLVIFSQIGYETVLMSTALYFSFYMVGVFVSKFESLEKMIEHPIVYCASFITFCVLSTHCSTVGSFVDDAIKIVVSLCSFVVLFHICRLIENCKGAKFLSLMGRNSLAIYCSHWFLLCIVVNRSWDIQSINPFWVLLVSALIALVISFVCILFASFLETNQYLGFFFLGKKLK